MVPINFEALICGLTIDLNCTIKKNFSHNKGLIHLDRNLPTIKASMKLYNNIFCPTRNFVLAIKLAWNFLVF